MSSSISGTTLGSGTELKPIMTMLIESGMFTFVGQIFYVVLFRIQSSGWYVVSTPLSVIYVSSLLHNFLPL